MQNAINLYERALTFGNLTGNCNHDKTGTENRTSPFFPEKKRNNATLSPKLTLATIISGLLNNKKTIRTILQG